MSDNRPMPAPRGAGKAAAVIAAVAVLLIIMIFVGLNMQHAKELGDQKAGQVQPQNQPQTPTDLGRSPVKPSKP
jgi:hypothetical protein